MTLQEMWDELRAPARGLLAKLAEQLAEKGITTDKPQEAARPYLRIMTMNLRGGRRLLGNISIHLLPYPERKEMYWLAYQGNDLKKNSLFFDRTAPARDADELTKEIEDWLDPAIMMTVVHDINRGLGSIPKGPKEWMPEDP